MSFRCLFANLIVELDSRGLEIYRTARAARW